MAKGKKQKIPKLDRRALKESKRRKSRLQVASLCYRITKKGNLRILLITSRETRRWITPKGWPMPRKTHAETALIEAHEEAGVHGRIDPASVGFFSYRKDLGNNRRVRCTVRTFAVEVERMDTDFREAGQRTLKWFTPKKAAKRVREPELRKIIRRFAQRVETPKTSASDPSGPLDNS